MAEYVPPVSPDIDLTFSAGGAYVPPVSPDIDLIFGDDSGGGQSGYLQANFMILLTM